MGCFCWCWRRHSRDLTEKERATASAIARESHTSSASDPRRRMKDLTPEEQKAALAFLRSGIQAAFAYMAMTEEDVEEYRLAGKLHTYDPDVEVEKRLARVAKKFPPPHGFRPQIEEYMKLIEDEDD
ncbi:hypothetical protein BS78_03G058500 [Paspalum vaginatum]|nr:hypothetical protein BS78_03G058500 [Paspalum vaginatum]